MQPDAARPSGSCDAQRPHMFAHSAPAREPPEAQPRRSSEQPAVSVPMADQCPSKVRMAVRASGLALVAATPSAHKHAVQLAVCSSPLTAQPQQTISSPVSATAATPMPWVRPAIIRTPEASQQQHHTASAQQHQQPSYTAPTPGMTPSAPHPGLTTLLTVHTGSAQHHQQPSYTVPTPGMTPVPQPGWSHC